MNKSIIEERKKAKEAVAQIIQGQSPLPKYEDVKKHVKVLKACHEHGLARKLIAMAKSQERTADQSVWLMQQLALCTYKDEELMPVKRFEDALKLLGSIGLYDPDKVDTESVPEKTLPETLAMGGAIKKRAFEHRGQLEFLYDALAFYRKAWQLNPTVDMGYGGINAAYVLDLLADRLRVIASRTSTDRKEADRHSEEAAVLRREILATLKKEGERNDKLSESYWHVVTLAEASFGIGEFTEAGNLLEKARRLSADEWEQQTTFRQLVSLARLHEYIPPGEDDDPSTWEEPWKALAKFFEDGPEMAFSCWRGRVGLALSGGGFRASLYHLGVLARLAEMDVLRAVEVISTVSGGSIIGTHYYLALQDLLTTRNDTDIKREDYVSLVLEVQSQFLKAVQKNIRTRALSNLWCNLKMLIPRIFGTRAYTRSHRIGELFESMLYDQQPKNTDKESHRTMSSLLIKPHECDEKMPFKPKFSNWRRRAKVPIILINATALNTGNNWLFTASWMGVPPGLLGNEVDCNARYRRLYYHQAPLEELKHYRLGHAVAASACVPALFEPLEIRGLYPGHTVRLVDGGVYDNQGIQGLLDESCTFILGSDASGQMKDEPSPSNNILGVTLRSTSILQDRVRESQYQDVAGRNQNNALDGLFFVHLKKGLKPASIDWIKCKDPGKELPHLNTMPYGIDRELQDKIANLRTDLDTFTEVEANLLMLSGYLMTEHEFKLLDQKYHAQGKGGRWGGFQIDADRDNRWSFLRLLPFVGKDSSSSDLRRKDIAKQLDVGASKLFKVWQLYPALKATVTIGLTLAVLAVSWLLFKYRNIDVGLGTWKLGPLGLTVVLIAAGLVWPVLKWLTPRRAMRGWLMRFILAVGGWIFSNVHILFFDPAYKRRGTLRRLLRLPPD